MKRTLSVFFALSLLVSFTVGCIVVNVERKSDSDKSKDKEKTMTTEVEVTTEGEVTTK